MLGQWKPMITKTQQRRCYSWTKFKQKDVAATLPHTICIWPSSAEVARIGTSAFMQPPSFLNHHAGGENKAKLRK